MKQLLQRKPAYRLGQGTSGAGAIKKHPWFAGFDWDAFVAKKLKAPYMPVVSRKQQLCRGLNQSRVVCMASPATATRFVLCLSRPLHCCAALLLLAQHTCTLASTFKTMRSVSVVVCLDPAGQVCC